MTHIDSIGRQRIGLRIVGGYLCAAFIESWPRVHEGPDAEQFQRTHWWRVAFNLVGSAAIFKAFFVYYRGIVVSEESPYPSAGCRF